MRKILGVHCGHDSAAALVIDGQIVADAAEERFTRVKNDSSFPLNAIQFCLEYADMALVPFNSKRMGWRRFLPRISPAL
jgi:carbamoyltransferase